MTDLSEFLLARIAEDESVARAAVEVGSRWQVSDREVVAFGSPNVETARVVSRGEFDCNAVTEEPTLGEWAEHIARHDPARVLAECDAKRRIVELHQPQMDSYDGIEFFEVALCITGSEPFPCPTLRRLALPYADHPDYRQEWKPGS